MCQCKLPPGVYRSHQSAARLNLLLGILMFFLLTSCGLPEYAVIEKPVKFDTGSSTVLGFTTPADDTNISGYALYYKIYAGITEYNAANDDFYFDPSNYDIGNEEELQPGNVVPKQREFVRAGELGKTTLPANIFNIPHTVASDPINIDFNSTGAEDDNDRAEPLVTSTFNGQLLILARGYIDIREGVTDKKLRQFVDDWYFSDTSEGFFDGDLRRPPSPQPGSDSGIFTGEPIFYSVSSHANLLIAFVVYSVGYDPDTFTSLASQPVFLGKVEYAPIYLNEGR